MKSELRCKDGQGGRWGNEVKWYHLYTENGKMRDGRKMSKQAQEAESGRYVWQRREEERGADRSAEGSLHITRAPEESSAD